MGKSGLSYMGDDRVGIGKVALSVSNIVLAVILALLMLDSVGWIKTSIDSIVSVILLLYGIVIVVSALYDGFQKTMAEIITIMVGALAIVLGLFAGFWSGIQGIAALKGFLFLILMMFAIAWAFISKK